MNTTHCQATAGNPAIAREAQPLRGLGAPAHVVGLR